MEEADDLRQEVARLTVVLSQVVETQATHTKMLQAILGAAYEPTSDLTPLLLTIVEALAKQSEQIARIHAAVAAE